MNAQDLKKPYETNWERVRKMSDEEIDASDIPPLDETFFANARLRVSGKKVSVTRGNRSRNNRGRLRAVRSDTLVRTIEQRYNIDLGMRGDAHIGTALDRYGVGSVTELVKMFKGRR